MQEWPDDEGRRGDDGQAQQQGQETAAREGSLGGASSHDGVPLPATGYAIAPLVLAMVIGDRAEDAFRQSMILSQGSLAILWSNALVGTLSTLSLVLFAFPFLNALRARRAAQPLAERHE